MVIEGEKNKIEHFENETLYEKRLASAISNFFTIFRGGKKCPIEHLHFGVGYPLASKYIASNYE